MIVRPKRWLHDESLKVVASEKNTLYIECEVIGPKSQVGKTVNLFLDGKEGDVDKMLLACRDVAIAMRRD